MKKIWIITDTHLGHDAMVQYCGRPENHSELILKHLRNNVMPGDTLIHLGDICIGDDVYWHKQLAKAVPMVRRILVRGNHDRKSDAWYLDHGWFFVCERFDNIFFGKRIAFSHRPIPDDSAFALNVHGHFHNTLHRIQKENWVVEGEKERNAADLKVLTSRHRLLAIENTALNPVLLQNFIK